MVYLTIPYVPENNRVDKDTAIKELQSLNISDDAKYEVFKAIYHLHPREVAFEDKDLKEVIVLESILSRLGIPYRQSDEPEFS